MIIDLAFHDENLSGGADGAMKAARSVVGHFMTSTQSLEKLLEVQRNFGKVPLSVIQDIVTRWWSTYTMCERLVVLKLYILLILGNNPQIPHLTDDQWKLVEAQVKVLEPFMVIQKVLEGQKYVTVSLIPFLLHKVRVHLDTSIDNPNMLPAITGLLQKMRADFETRWGTGMPGSVFDEHKTLGHRRRRKGIPLLTMQAAALDPRTKGMKGLGGVADQEKVFFFFL